MQRRYVYYRQGCSPRFPGEEWIAPDLPGVPDSDPALFLKCLERAPDLTCFTRSGLQVPVHSVFIGMTRGKESFGHLLAPFPVMVQ